ncbi:hypothetical protein BOX15_Mlig030860g2 [Macrostomum lignano]|uniref:Uncharacterized protein n=1 Tax=Macrostomum lignano TaxID=282301 RepID=A0A267FVL3_9PLAT|nr:hypothetical protein BOX15_Mlig030860g3 [Macrostomum lignano]PAA77776.1 hypothetical protein BOX15_Mlig030860g2 [Macrostomum lignano]
MHALKSVLLCSGSIVRSIQGTSYLSILIILVLAAYILRPALLYINRLLHTTGSSGRHATQRLLTSVIAMVIKISRANYRTSRVIREASKRTENFLHALLVLPLICLQIFDLSFILFDFFRAVIMVFANFMGVVFSYAIFIFNTYKIVVMCTASIMLSVYYTSYYSILLIRSGLAFLDTFRTLMQHNALRLLLIRYKEQKMRVANVL